MASSPFNAGNSLLDDFRPGLLQLELAMNLARGDENVNSRLGRAGQGFARPVDVQVPTSRSGPRTS